MSNISGILCFIIPRTVKTQLKCKKGLVQCMVKVLLLTEHVKSSLGSLVLDNGCSMVG